MTDDGRKQLLKYLAAFAAGAGTAAALFTVANSKKQLREALDLNDPQDMTAALRALYVIAHEMVHADGVEEERELKMIVTLVRRLMDNPVMGKEPILREYRRHRGVKMEDEAFLSLSQAYRSRLFICALHIAFSDEKFPDAEMHKLRDIAGRLGLIEKEMFARLEHIENLEDVKKMIPRLPPPDIRQWACGVLEVPSNATPEQCAEARRRAIRAVLNIAPDATEDQCQDAYIRIGEKEIEDVNGRLDEIDEAFSILIRFGAEAGT